MDFVPETLNIHTLFKMMQVKKSHMVVVVDEYGQTSGVVAMEDILEEIVGNIEDEHDDEEQLELNSLPPWDAATLALIHLTISISLELAKALSITILRQKLEKISLSHQKR